MPLLNLIKPIYKIKTPLIKGEKIKSVLGLSNVEIYFKWEGINPTGTHKDRAALRHVINAIDNGFNTITVGTCGNFGVAISYFANLYGIKAVIFIPKDYTNKRINEMIHYGARIIFVDGKYEDAVERSINEAFFNGWYDANPGSINARISIEAYRDIAFEIYESIGRPDYVAIPVGNGTLFAGVYEGFKHLKEKKLIDAFPILIATSTSGGNQIIYSWKLKSSSLIPLSPNMIKETEINEPLVAYKSYEGELVLKALSGVGGMAFEFTDRELINAADLIRKTEGLDVLPASASSLLALFRLSSMKKFGGIFVSVLTGRRF